MDFNHAKSIYLQIVDYVCEQILCNKWKPGNRLLSVRELGSTLEVNPNTVLRSYEILQNMNIITNKRGIGYFVGDNAIEKIQIARKERFFKEELPVLFKNMDLLQINFSEIENYYNEFHNNK